MRQQAQCMQAQQDTAEPASAPSIACPMRLQQPADSVAVMAGAQGPTAREARRDVTAFETARAEWSRSDVSIRGKGVGAEGDHGVEVWLG